MSAQTKGMGRLGKAMVQMVRARYQSGLLEPLEPLALEEGCEVWITVNPSAPELASAKDPTLATSGVFGDSSEWAEFEKELEERRCRGV